MRRGASLIECLVVVAIVGVLVCLLLPAIQSARSQAREANCVQNLKQMGLALHNYLSATTVFPMSAVAGDGRGRGQSCFTLVLPFLEKSAIYNAYNFSLENWHEANDTAVATRVNEFLCPDNPNITPVPASQIRTIDGNFYPGESTFARGHYGANWGGERAGWGIDFEKAHGTFRGVMMTIPSRGPKGANTNVSIGDVTDGSAWTVAMGEKRDSLGWGVGGWGGSEFDPGKSPDYSGDDPTTMNVYTGAFHNLPHFLFCDGSVRPLSGTTQSKIWYALLTRDGGETLKESDLESPTDPTKTQPEEK